MPKQTEKFLVFCCVIRINQIEIYNGLELGVDERLENTPENLERFRSAVRKAVPVARITFALSYSAIYDKNTAKYTVVCQIGLLATLTISTPLTDQPLKLLYVILGTAAVLPFVTI